MPEPDSNLAAAAATSQAGNDQAYQDEGVSGVDALQVLQRYGEERAKRVRPEGNEQYIDVSLSDKFQHFADDPWVDAEHPVPDVHDLGGKCRVLILGAGYGGLLFAVRMIAAGIKPEDIRMVDSAGGFGGTWYWNRYPGLMCDVESYLYMPLLEETGYIPKHRYAYGPELREYADQIAAKWNVADKAIFQAQVKSLVWDEATKEWKVEVVQTRKGQQPQTANIRSQFVVTASGLLNFPKLPGIPGIEDYQGQTFHTSRWNYDYTGGSPTDPSLAKLHDKNVAIIGTGATAVQAVPQLARWAKHLYVFQRTPSSVDVRGQRATDPEWFRKEVANTKSWQRSRAKNYHSQLTTDERKPKTNLVDDAWSRVHAYGALVGNPAAPLRLEDIPGYLQQLHMIDLERQGSVRKRTKQIVKDPQTAEKLLPWYPSWCKRPCFHDDYLPTFNQPNVTLVDTSGTAIDSITKDSLVIDRTSYPADVIIFSTGFRAPVRLNAADCANITVHGRNSKSMSEEWVRAGPNTLHGSLSIDFPNLFFSGPAQAGISGNQLSAIDGMAQHAAYIVAAADKKAGGQAYAVEPTAPAVDEWGMQLMMRAAALAGLANCTPGYLTGEGEVDRPKAPEEQMKAARGSIWGHGIEDYFDVVDAWRAEGSMRGLEVRT